MTPYIKITLQPLADGLFEIKGIKKFRDLDTEVERVYKKQHPRMIYNGDETSAVWCDSSVRNLKTGDLLTVEEVKHCQEANARLLAIEANVAEARLLPEKTIYIGGEKSCVGERFTRVLDCCYTDGSVYTCVVRDDDYTPYEKHDIVQVEHIGNHKKEFLRVVNVRYFSNHRITEQLSCSVIRWVAKTCF